MSPLRADHPGAAQEDRREDHDQELARHPRREDDRASTTRRSIFAWVGGRPTRTANNVIWLSSAIPEQCSQRLAKADECDYSGQNYTKVEGPAGRRAPQRGRHGARPRGAGRALQPGRPAARAQRRHRDPAVPEAHAARVPRTPSPACATTRPQDGFTWNIEDWTLHADSDPADPLAAVPSGIARLEICGDRVRRAAAGHGHRSSSCWRRSSCSCWSRRVATRCATCATVPASPSRRSRNLEREYHLDESRPEQYVRLAGRLRAGRLGRRRSAPTGRSPTWSARRRGTRSCSSARRWCSR